MPSKDMYLFDSTNAPLRVSGISLKLFDAHTGTLLDSKLSANYNPGNPLSNEWGAKLSFTAGSHPVEVYVTDPGYKYPGNTVHYLNGQTTDRVDIDLIVLPTGKGGQPSSPVSAAPGTLSKWVASAPNWKDEEKFAVWKLISSYISVIVPRVPFLSYLPDLAAVAENWEKALDRVGIPYSILRQ